MLPQGDLAEQYFALLEAIQNETYRNKSNHLSPELLSQITYMATQIHERRRGERFEKLKNRSYYQAPRETESPPFRMSEPTEKKKPEKPKRVRPYYLRIMNEVFSPDCLNECVLQFLGLEELLPLRLVNKNFNNGVLIHLGERIKSEEETLRRSIFSSEEFVIRLKQICISQFPTINGTWLCLDRFEIKQRLANTFTRNDLEKMKYLKNIPEQYDDLFAPFCIIFDLKPAVIQHADGTIQKNWKKTFINFTSNAHFTNILISFDLVLIKEEKAMQILDALNKITLDDEQIQKLNLTLYLVIDWCRTVFDSYLCRNIFRVRNPHRLEGQEDAELLESLRKRIDYLRGLKHLIHAHTDESFLLDFSDFKLVAPLKRSLTVTFEPKVLKKIISFLEIEETIQLRAVNKLLKGLSEEYIKDLTELSIYFYETTKFKHKHLYKKIPILYELGLFSKGYLVLENMLHVKESFLTKKDIEELRRIMKPSKFQEGLCKAFCVLFRQEPKRNRIQNI